MNIRRAKVEDVNDINVLLRQVLDIHNNIRPDIFKDNTKKYTDEELIQIINDNNRPIFVAEENSRVVGYVFCVFILSHVN